MATGGVVLIKSFTYRDASEEFSNGYHFVGTPPSDATGWNSLVAALATIEKVLYPSTTTIVRAYCYDDYSPGHSSVYTWEAADHGGAVPGTLDVGSGGVHCPGDAAVWARWKTTYTSSKGKPVYLRKYIHPAIAASSDPDLVYDAQHSALASYATAVAASSGAWPGLADPHGAAPAGATAVSEWVTTRTLERRGRRPT